MAVVGVSLGGARARRVVAGVWAFRVGAERQARLRFARLASELRACNAIPSVVETALRAEDDELRHADLCADIASRYGHRGAFDAPDAAARIGPRDAAQRERVLYELVAFCCVTESINTALMMVSLQRATEPIVRAAVREILADEIQHARLGWAHLAAERERGNALDIAAALPAMLAGTVREELFAPPDAQFLDDSLAGHGELPRAMRLEIFDRTLRDVVFPGLERLAIDTTAGREWVETRRRARPGIGAQVIQDAD